GRRHSKTTSIRPEQGNFLVIMGIPEEEKPRPPSDITVFGANCTLHGLSHIFLPGGVTLRRLLWAAAFSTSLSIFLYQVADRVIEYYRYPHVTILDEMDSPVMYFPAVTLCNYNSFRKSQIRRNDIFWMAGLLGVEQGDFDEFMAAVGQPTDNSKFFPSKTFNMLEFVQRTSHSMEEMLLDCKYRGKDCGPENFTTVSKLPGHLSSTQGQTEYDKKWQ
ncbi:Acid-sensing ion channel 3, partial [Takifugu flavidus]